MVKSITVLLMMIVLVAGIAVSSSRASPVVRASAAVARCLGPGGTATSYLCQPIAGEMNERLDGDDFGDSIGADLGGDSSDPEARWAKVLHAVAVVAEAAANLLDQLTYGPQVSAPAALTGVDELFDTSVE